MTKSAKKITTMTRRHEFYVLRRRLRFQLYCQQCDAEIDFITLDDAVLFSGLATREIVRMANEGKLHFLETSGGHLFICQKSLLINESAGPTKFVQDGVFPTHQPATNLEGEKI